MPVHPIDKVIDCLAAERGQKVITFHEFTEALRQKAPVLLRSIFQLFHDMIHYYNSETVNEYPDDTESIGFLKYNLDDLFIHDTEKPFFADRLFANRLVALAKSFRLTSAPHKIFVFQGPAGSGKSTFLNNLLEKMECYMRSDDGLVYEVVWRLPRHLADGGPEWPGHREPDDVLEPGDGAHGRSRERREPGGESDAGRDRNHERAFFEVPCPNHDNPIFLIPRAYREEFLRELVPANDYAKKLFKHKQYQWIFKTAPCTICSSIFNALSERFSVRDVFSMLHARRYLFNRRQGEGISVFNSGDDLERSMVRSNEQVQQFLNRFFNDSNKVPYSFSSYAKTNQGIRALMDLKGRNIQRFLELHGIISDEVHKVQDLEERIRSLFIVLMNPGDIENIAKSKHEVNVPIDESLKDRIHLLQVPYVVDYQTEIRIYINAFGPQIAKRFMPRVLENFAKVIVSSRIKGESRAIKDWIKNRDQYAKHCDPEFYILKMFMYTGIIPEWLTKEDRDALKAEVRKAVLGEAEREGFEGYSGRESLQVFNDFYTNYQRRRPITMRHLADFFLDDAGGHRSRIPRNFIKHLIDLYDFEVLMEVKDSMYSYNEEEIRRTILNYLVAISHNIGDTVKNPYLNSEEFQVTSDFLEIVESHLLGATERPAGGSQSDRDKREKFRSEAVAEYASKTLAREIKIEGLAITETKQFRELYAQFTKTAREKVLEPYLNNSNFRCAIKEFGTPDFEKYDTKIKERLRLLFANLAQKYGYDDIEKARTVTLYVFDQDLPGKFA